MSEYRVSWHIDLEAASPEEAAEMAQAIQRDPASLATVFHVAELIAPHVRGPFVVIDTTSGEVDHAH